MRGATRRNSNARMTQHRFQSTLLMRGATSGLRRQSASKRNFNPRSSCEERRGTGSSRQIFLHFNPRSSCEERHVLHYRRADWHHFNPRSSCEERLEIPHSTPGRTEFQSTLLMRGATEKRSRGREGDVISIHAPHARSDTTDTNKRKCGDISIHAPHARSDAVPWAVHQGDLQISIHAPHARSDVDGDISLPQDDISIHAPHARSDARR